MGLVVQKHVTIIDCEFSTKGDGLLVLLTNLPHFPRFFFCKTRKAILTFTRQNAWSIKGACSVKYVLYCHYLTNSVEYCRFAFVREICVKSEALAFTKFEIPGAIICC